MISTRIALVGSPASLKTQTSELLSKKLNLDYVSIAKDFEFHLPDNTNFKCTKIWQMVTSLAYFHERIRNESIHSFISDGSAMHEFMLTKAQNIAYNHKGEKFRGKEIQSKSEQDFEDRFAKIATEYINKSYDHIFFIYSDAFENDKDRELDDVFKRIFHNLMENTHVKYTCLKGKTEELIDQIVKEIT
jgi:hypothetical protein